MSARRYSALPDNFCYYPVGREGCLQELSGTPCREEPAGNQSHARHQEGANEQPDEQHIRQSAGEIHTLPTN